MANRSSNSRLNRKISGLGVFVVLILSLYFFPHFYHVLLLVFGGILLAVFLSSLSDLLEQKTPLPYGWALIVVIVFILISIFTIERLVGQRILNQIFLLVEQIPDAIESIRTEMMESQLGKRILATAPKMDQIWPLGPEILGGITGFFSSILGIFFNGLFILFVGIYAAINPSLYIQNAVKLLPVSKRDRAFEVFSALGNALHWWMFGRIASMCIVGILTAAGLWIAGVPLALALGFIAALFSFVPILGPLVSAVPAVIVALAVKPIMAVYVVIVYSLVQLFETYFITPLIQQRTVSLPPVLLLVFQIILGGLFGVMGVLFATPLIVAIIVLIQMLYIVDVLGDSVKVLGEH